MRLLDPDATSALLRDPVHLDTQRADAGLDLTVDEVARVTGPGKLDFGGSEFEEADGRTLEPELASPDDDYGWWRLEEGAHLVLYNESLELAGDRLGLVHPLPRVLRAGASHPAFVADGDRDALVTLLSVGSGGCRLKENCRLSRLLVIDAA